MSITIRNKLARLATGEPPRLLDLFSGCGGLTLGFVRAGCESIGAIEIDPHAIRTHGNNFHGGAAEHVTPRDITKTDALDLLRSFGHSAPTHAVDVLVGGPPCPAFTRVGRAKLREIQDHPEAHLHDPRAKLYVPYLEYVKALKPVALLMENVPDILNWSGHNLAEEICDELERLHYRCTYTLLNAAHYGVPQMRERFFLVAIHEEADPDAFAFPEPVCSVDFPPGYKGARNVALKGIRSMSMFTPSTRFVDSPLADPAARGPISVGEAIQDLPPITGHLDGTIRRGARKFDTPVGYCALHEPSSFGALLRSWSGFESEGMIWDHSIRSLSQRDYRLFRRMKPSDDYPRAHAIALDLFQRALGRARDRGEQVLPSSQSWGLLLRSYVPPYDAGKFPNKWHKLDASLPARTLMAHLGKDSYSHIHHDSRQARVISVREAARLQSFPDGFRFSGTMNPAFRQIGNAVPPILGWALADQLLHALGRRHESVGSTWRETLQFVVTCSHGRNRSSCPDTGGGLKPTELHVS